MKIKKCAECGRENDLDGFFDPYVCKFCGADLTKEKAVEKTLTACPDCGKEISVKAKVCPGCGRPTDTGIEDEKTKKRNKRGNTQGMGCLIMLISIICIVLSPYLSGLLFIIGFVILIMGFFI